MPSKKNPTITALKKEIIRHRRQGKKIVFTNGCFDILHWGHVQYLQTVKKTNRILVVGLNSDSSIREIKGPKRPILPQQARLNVLTALECVDYVIMFNEATPYRLISSVKPDILVKGADWKGKQVVGSDVVEKSGGKVEYIKYLPKYSTSNIIETILKRCS